jgi:hypothetical protein
MHYPSEFRRCLLEMDVEGIMRVWSHVSPHLPQPSPAEAAIQLHMARVEARYMPRKAKEYSASWLAEQGYAKIGGEWVHGISKPKPVVEAVGISSQGLGGIVRPINEKIMVYMEDALLNALAKGVNEPPMQKEAMLKARDKVRFKARMA